MLSFTLLLGLLAGHSSAEPAPDFRLAAVRNAPVATLAGLKDLRGKAVFLEFWATWCGPCVKSIPRMNRLAEALQGQPFVFLSVTDEDSAAVEAFRKTHEMKAWVGLDRDRSAFRAYRVSGLPAGFLIGKDGTLLAAMYPDELTERDARSALAGTFAPRPVKWDGGSPSPADEPSRSTPYFEARLAPAADTGKGEMYSDSNGIGGRSLPFDKAIAWIWDIEPDQVVFDSAPVAALDFTLKAPPARLQEGRRILQDAVRTAFGLRVRTETRQLDALALSLVDPEGTARPRQVPAGEHVGIFRSGNGRIVGSSPMSQAARVFWRVLRTPVLDETGLKGAYEFDLEWPRGDRKALEALLAAQGLRLVPVRRPIECLTLTRAPAPPPSGRN